MLRRIPLQVGEEGVRYYFRSSSSTTEDSEEYDKDMSGSRNGEGLNDCSPGKTVRGAGHAGSRPSTGKKLREKSRTEEESQVIEKGEGGSREAKPPVKIKDKGNDTPHGQAPEEGDPEGQQPPKGL